MLGLACSQQEHGIESAIWSLDAADAAKQIEKENCMRSGSICGFSSLGPRWLGYSPLMEIRLRTNHELVDVVHQHGIWTALTRASAIWRRRTSRPTVLTVHGALEPVARQRSCWKKGLALVAYEADNLTHAGCFHALSEAEANSIRNCGYRSPIAVIPNGVPSWWTTGCGNANRFVIKHQLPPNARRMLFLGRITPLKGLPMFLHALASVKQHINDWCFVIAGVDEFGHLAEVKAQVEQLGLQEQIFYVGPQYGDDKKDAFAAADLFVLPSLSEASPISILEALGSGVPVLTTYAVDWSDLEAMQCGWRANGSATDMAQTLAKVLQLDHEFFISAADRCRSLIATERTWGQIAARTIQLYEWLLYGGATPSFVYKS